MSGTCMFCCREFTHKSNLTRHMRMVHNMKVNRIDTLPGNVDQYHYKCLEGCEISFKYNRELRNHLRNEHQIQMVEMQLEFPNEDEFAKWLHLEEDENCVQFVHITAPKRKTTGTETFYYECNRTVKRSPIDNTVRKRKSRYEGSPKIIRGCTSQIIVKKSYDGSYSVNYFKSHYGHEINIENIKLSRHDRETVASKLLLGMPVANVLQSVSNPNGQAKRINLLRRKDVVNIRKSYNLSLRDGKMVNFDSININTFIEECAKLDYNPIMYCTSQDTPKSNDICFMIMTEDQCKILREQFDCILINSCPLSDCVVELIAMFVVLKSGDSFLAACMFTNRNDSDIFKLFYSKIFERVGTQLRPEYFITDCKPVYYDEWCEVMQQVEFSFYDSNQIDMDWKLNLNRITCEEVDVTKVKRKWVHETLNILRNIRSVTEFSENLEETIRVMAEDIDFKNFLEYFVGNYTEVKMWAECYRSNVTVDFSILDNITEELKTYLKSESSTRLDKIFEGVIRYIRNETVNYLLKFRTNQSAFISENNTRHNVILEKHFDASNPSENLWHVCDQHTSNTYLVQRLLRKNCCNLICSVCKICMHTFMCTCVDFFVSNVICEHIHYIWMTHFNFLGESSENEDTQECILEEIIIEVDQEDGENVSAIKGEISEQIDILNTNVSQLHNSETLNIVLDNVKYLCDISSNTSDYLVNMRDQVLTDHSYVTNVD